MDLTGKGPFKIDDKELRDYPKSAIGLIVSKEGVCGTGCLIGPNIVLTCASNCYSRKEGREFG